MELYWILLDNVTVVDQSLKFGTHTHMDTQRDTRDHTRTHIYTCVHIHIHIHMHTHMHIYHLSLSQKMPSPIHHAWSLT